MLLGQVMEPLHVDPHWIKYATGVVFETCSLGLTPSLLSLLTARVIENSKLIDLAARCSKVLTVTKSILYPKAKMLYLIVNVWS